MLTHMLKCKVHRATVTDANLAYEGSISIDRALCDLAGLREFEQVDVLNCNNGERLTTYVIYGEKGEICLNGAAARKVQRGDIVIICAYGTYSAEELTDYKPKLVRVDGQNKPIEIHFNFPDKQHEAFY